MSIFNLSQRLPNPDIERFLAPFLERRASIRRCVVAFVAFAWTYYWAIQPPTAYLHAQAASALPVVTAILLVSLAWALCVRTAFVHRHLWVEVTGTLMDFVGIATMIKLAWTLLGPFAGLLPLACVSTGARFNKTAATVAVVASVAIIIACPPPAYWAGRPTMVVLAAVLIIGIPITFNRILSGLTNLSEQAIRARDAQGRFLAMMSHELRTPLHSVIHSASLMDAYQDPDEKRALVKSITSNATVLLSRLTDALDVAASESGQILLSDGPFDLRSVMETVESVVGHLARAKGVAFTIRCEDGRPTSFRGDARRIEQVITNLSSNAIKYTAAHGTVAVRASTRRIASNSPTESAEIMVTIADTGIGIPDDQKQRIFEPFHQVSSGDRRTHDGVGLGLHIVKIISDRLGATIHVKDNPGGGTVFTWLITLPVAQPETVAANAQNAAAMLAEHRLHTQPLRCLVIDDNPANRDILERMLKLAGHSVELAPDGERGLAQLQTSAYDITFLDLHMPGLSGLDVLEALMFRHGKESMPRVVILTASTESGVRERALQANAYGYLHKPLSTTALLDILSTVARAVAPNQSNHTTADQPIALLREIANPSAVRAYIQACIEELETTLHNLARSEPTEPTELIRTRLHSLKNAVMSAGTIDLSKPHMELLNGSPSHAELQQRIPLLEQLVADALTTLRTAPEMA